MKKYITPLLSLLLAAALCTTALAATGKTVLLTAPAEEEGTAAKDQPGPEAQSVSRRQWLRELAGGGVRYRWNGKSQLPAYTALPAHCPTELPEGWALSGTDTVPLHPRNTTAVWTWLLREDGETRVLTFTCFRPQSQACGVNFGPEFDTAALRRDARVRGRSGDYFQIPDSDQGDLFWEDGDGNLFHLSGPRELGQAGLEKIAASVKEVLAEPLPAYQMTWTPEGFCRSRSTTALQMASETWTRYIYSENQPTVRAALHWRWSKGVRTTVPQGEPETVTVKGVQAQYWPGDPDAGYVDAVSVGGEVIQVNPAPEQTGTLIWTDPGTEVTFRLDAPLEKEVLLRAAESIAEKQPSL